MLIQFPPGEKSSNLYDDTSLRMSGNDDSMGMWQMVSFIEEWFVIKVEAYEAGVENCDRVEDIAAFIERKHALKA